MSNPGSPLKWAKCDSISAPPTCWLTLSQSSILWGEKPVTSTVVGLIETGLKNCLEPCVNSGVSGLRLPLLHQNCPPEPLDLGCLHIGQVLQLSTLGNSDNSVHPVHSSRGLTVLRMILCSGVRATGPGILMLSVPSSSPRTLMK
jgi:hypothetical protein